MIQSGHVNGINSYLNLNRSKDLFDRKEIAPSIENCGSIFQFLDKERILGDKELIRATLLESKQRLQKVKPKPNKNKLDQEAPASIKNKVESKKFIKDKQILKRNTKNVEIPNFVVPDLKLKNISEFNEFNMPTGDFDYYFGGEDLLPVTQEVLTNEGNFIQDDINHIVDPIEFVRRFNVKCLR